MQRPTPPIAHDLARAVRPLVRLSPIMHLEDGKTMALAAESLRQFDERPGFGPMAAAAQNSAAEWLARELERLAELGPSTHPVLMPAPAASLADANTAMACEAAVKRSNLCPQEICFEFTDAAFATDAASALNGIERLKKRGFRVGIDMRQSQNTPLGTGLRLMLDSLRLQGHRIFEDSHLTDCAEAGAAAGIGVIADQPAWRDGPALANLGVVLAQRPTADA